MIPNSRWWPARLIDATRDTWWRHKCTLYKFVKKCDGHTHTRTHRQTLSEDACRIKNTTGGTSMDPLHHLFGDYAKTRQQEISGQTSTQYKDKIGKKIKDMSAEQLRTYNRLAKQEERLIKKYKQ